MPVTWDRIAEKEDFYTASDFQQAAYQLITEQVLYESAQTQRKAFQIVQRHLGAFKEAVALFGLELFVNQSYRYCYAVPKDVRQSPLSLEDTLLILVLRQLYHDRAGKGDLDTDGRAVLEIEDLKQAYKGATGRELPTGSIELREKIQGLRRFGVARAIDPAPGSIQPFDVCIMPGIEELVNETAVSRLGAYLVAVSAESAAGNGREADDETA